MESGRSTRPTPEQVINSPFKIGGDEPPPQITQMLQSALKRLGGVYVMADNAILKIGGPSGRLPSVQQWDMDYPDDVYSLALGIQSVASGLEASITQINDRL